MANSYKATWVNIVASFFFSFLLSSAHAGLNSSLSFWWISNWLWHSAACCMCGPVRAGIVECAFPEVCRKYWICTPLSHNQKLSLSRQITNMGHILVCSATSFTVNNEVAYCCSVYLLKYCYFKNAWISFKFPFFFNFQTLVTFKFVRTLILEICKSFLRTWTSFPPLEFPCCYARTSLRLHLSNGHLQI